MKTEAQNIDLKTFPFPVVTRLDLVCSTFNTIPELLREAEARGFANYNNPYCKLFSQLFFNGGKLKFKEGIDKDFFNKAWAYCRALMRSFGPKHEHKQAVCAMLLSELVEPELQEVKKTE